MDVRYPRGEWAVVVTGQGRRAARRRPGVVFRRRCGWTRRVNQPSLSPATAGATVPTAPVALATVLPLQKTVYCFPVWNLLGTLMRVLQYWQESIVPFDLNMPNPAGPKRTRLSRAAALIVISIIITVLAWHVLFTDLLKTHLNKILKINAQLSATINPLTNVVNIEFLSIPNKGFSGAGILDSVEETILQHMNLTEFEARLNQVALQRYDFYAALVPYKFRVTSGEAGAEEAVRILGVLDWRHRDIEKRHEEEVQSYVNIRLKLTNLRVFPEPSVRRKPTTVSGTFVNEGNWDIVSVDIRIYFLDIHGERIGEKNSSLYVIQKLKPGYRHDFDIQVFDNAPSGWSGRIEAEIVDLTLVKDLRTV